MTAKQVTGQHGRETWLALWAVFLGALLYVGTVFLYDYFPAMKRGENGQAAIQMLDQMRRPFLALKQAEIRLLQSAGESPGIENAIQDGRRTLSQYLELASYNEEVRKKVVRLKASYGAWVALELKLVRTRELLAADPSMRSVHAELYALVIKNATAFLAVMEVLGQGEKPIHHDIDTGTAAVHGLLVSSLTFIAYLIAVAFWLEWVKHRQVRLRYESNIRLQHLVHTDSLTGLANSILLYERISIAIAAARRYGHRLGILYFYLDGFKGVNDELGHKAGDSVLKEVALRLQKHIREMDTAARVGEDEFVVVTTNVRDMANACFVADKLQAALNQPYELHGKPCPLQASIGIAMFPDDGEQPEQLLKHADIAIYEAKRMTKLSAARLRTE